MIVNKPIYLVYCESAEIYFYYVDDLISLVVSFKDKLSELKEKYEKSN